MHAPTRNLALGILLAAGVGFFALASLPCAPIEEQVATTGSHGYRIWSGPTLVSFEHAGGRVCVPRGWEPIGSVRHNATWAIFAPETTGVMVRSSAFAETALTFEHSSFEVTLRYPVEATTPQLLAEYEAMVRNAFERTGALFDDHPRLIPRPHTVLVTASIPASEAEAASIYPDPGINVSFLILKPSHVRSEELLVHAVAHLYNRHEKDFMRYQDIQGLMPPSDWQELEASWMETAFRTSHEGRLARIEYLYNVHQAVRTRDFSLIQEPPFDDRAAFDQMKGLFVIGDDASYLDTQYAHYVLGPLLMIGVEGLLLQNEAGANVETLLYLMHTEDIEDFLGALSTLLPSEEIDRIIRWLNGEETIDHALLLKGASEYAPR